MCFLCRPELGDSPRWNELSLDTVLAYCPTRYSTSSTFVQCFCHHYNHHHPHCLLPFKVTDMFNIIITITSLLWRAATKLCARKKALNVFHHMYVFLHVKISKKGDGGFRLETWLRSLLSSDTLNVCIVLASLNSIHRLEISLWSTLLWAVLMWYFNCLFLCAENSQWSQGNTIPSSLLWIWIAK